MRASRSWLAAGICAAVLVASDTAGARDQAACVVVPPLSAAAKQTLRLDARGVEKSVTVSQHGLTSVRWADVVNRRYRQVDRGPRGKIKLEFVVIGRRMVSVDYAARTIEIDTFPARVPTLVGVAAPALARLYRSSIAKRRAVIVGKQIVAGQLTIHVRELETFPPPSRAAEKREVTRLLKQLRKALPKGQQLPKDFPSLIAKADFRPEHWQVDTWLDAATCLPVRVRTISNGRLLDDTYNTFLRRTVLNLAKTHLVIPAGFHRYRRTPGGNSSNGVVDSWSYASVSTSPVAAGSAATAECHAP